MNKDTLFSSPEANQHHQDQQLYALVPYVSSKTQFVEAAKREKRSYYVGGRIYTIKQRWNEGDTRLGFGGAVFDSAVVLSHLLMSRKYRKEVVEADRVVELGCGLGLSSIVAAAIRKKCVIATDGDPDLFDLVLENAKNNLDAVAFASFQTKRLLWGSKTDADAVMKKECSFSEKTTRTLVIGSDIVACPYAKALPALVETLRYLLQNGGSAKAIIAYKPRLRSEDVFFEEARKHFDVSWVSQSDIHRDYRSRTGAEEIKVFELSLRRSA